MALSLIWQPSKSARAPFPDQRPALSAGAQAAMVTRRCGPALARYVRIRISEHVTPVEGIASQVGDEGSTLAGVVNAAAGEHGLAGGGNLDADDGVLKDIAILEVAPALVVPEDPSLAAPVHEIPAHLRIGCSDYIQPDTAASNIAMPEPRRRPAANVTRPIRSS
jgi:hypothetical protein